MGGYADKIVVALTISDTGMWSEEERAMLQHIDDPQEWVREDLGKHIQGAVDGYYARHPNFLMCQPDVIA